MSGVTAPAISAKCRAMYSRLLKQSDYSALLSYNAVTDVASYLKKETAYAHVLRRLNENDAHRGQLEKVFMRSLFYDCDKLLSFSGGAYRDVVMAAFVSYEIDDLKMVISAICSDSKSSIAADDLNFIRRYSEFRADDLVLCDSMQSLVEVLRGTRYHAVLAPFATKRAPDFLSVDTALDLLAHRVKMEAFSKLKGPCRKACLDLYGQECDVANIAFMYRMKELYRYNPAALAANAIPCVGRLRKENLAEMARCDGPRALEDLSALVAKTPYASLFPKGEGARWESEWSKHFCTLHRRNLRTRALDVNATLAYLHLKRVDIRNIVTIIEGTRYRLSPEQISSFLVGVA